VRKAYALNELFLCSQSHLEPPPGLFPFARMSWIVPYSKRLSRSHAHGYRKVLCLRERIQAIPSIPLSSPSPSTASTSSSLSPAMVSSRSAPTSVVALLALLLVFYNIDYFVGDAKVFDLSGRISLSFKHSLFYRYSRLETLYISRPAEPEYTHIISLDVNLR
jgi:hypothetical protein